MSDFYEPWAPGIGDYVEIHPSPECQIQGTPDSPQARAGLKQGHMLDLERGRRGWVTDIWDADNDPDGLARQGHRFRVRWDDPATLHGRLVFGASYAAAELAPTLVAPGSAGA